MRPSVCRDLKPSHLAFKVSAFTITLTWQVRVQDVEVCAQQACPIICQFVSGSEFGGHLFFLEGF